MNKLPDDYDEPGVNPEDEQKRILSKALQDMLDRRDFGVTWEEYLAEHEDE